jgi:protein phosphatase
MVLKPLDFISKGRRGIAQPAIKCSGPEYLRIIYGPEYLRERIYAASIGMTCPKATSRFPVEGPENGVWRHIAWECTPQIG